MESGKTAVDLLCAPDDSSAFEVGALIDSCNNDRKHVDRTITHEALRMDCQDIDYNIAIQLYYSPIVA
jgi:single-stranded-DNA-specific exonuclease